MQLLLVNDPSLPVLPADTKAYVKILCDAGYKFNIIDTLASTCTQLKVHNDFLPSDSILWNTVPIMDETVAASTEVWGWALYLQQFPGDEAGGS